VKKRILITGGAGSIGLHLADKTVCAWIRSSVTDARQIAFPLYGKKAYFIPLPLKANSQAQEHSGNPRHRDNDTY